MCMSSGFDLSTLVDMPCKSLLFAKKYYFYSLYFREQISRTLSLKRKKEGKVEGWEEKAREKSGAFVNTLCCPAPG